MHKRHWLIQMRYKAKLTQNDVSKRAGISRSGYSNIENGKRNPSVQTAKKIAKVLGFNWAIFLKVDCFVMNHRSGQSSKLGGRYK